MYRRLALWIIVAALPLSLFAQPIEIKLRVTPVDTPTRKADTNFQLGATSGFSVVQAVGNYYLFTFSQIRKAWMDNGIDVWDLVYPRRQDPNLCDQRMVLTMDARCGDNNWVVWKQPSSTSTGWNYFNVDTGQPARVAAVPAIGAWPYVWHDQHQPDYPKTGVPGQQTIVDAKKVNAAIPNPPVPNPLPPSTPDRPCYRNTFNPNYYATGTASTKAVYVNGMWFMAFNIDIDSPDANGVWTSGDMFRVGWATSTDGKSWTIRHLLFRTSRETRDCGGGLVLDQLFTDNGYFYLLADEQYDRGVIMLRAPINTSLTDGYTSWQVAAHDPANPNRFLWVNAPADGVLDTTALDAFQLMNTNTTTQQTVIGRVFTSAAPNSPSRLVAVTIHGALLDVWSAPDLDTPFTFESSIDLAYLKPKATLAGGNWEFAYTYDPNNTPATPTLIGNEFDFWMNGNFYPDGHGNSTGISFTGYRTTATLSGGIYSPRGSLRTAGNYYLSAASDNSINATPTSIGLDQRWVLIDANGGTLQSNDVVYLQARNGLYVTNNGGATLTASQAYPSVYETFVIEKKNAGSTTIVNGDLIALRSQATGKYIIASAGGGSTVFGNGLDTNPNTRFTFVAN